MTWTITKKKLFFKWHTSGVGSSKNVCTTTTIKSYSPATQNVHLIWRRSTHLKSKWLLVGNLKQLSSTFSSWKYIFCICPTSIFLRICKWISQSLFPFVILSLKHYFFKWLGKLYIHTSCCQVKLGIAWIKICIPFHVCCSMIKVKSWMAP